MTISNLELFPSTLNKINLDASISGRFTNLDADKLRGGYYTSSEVTRWICEWAITDKKDKILEPSCGDGAFLEAAVNRLNELGASSKEISVNLTGIEIIPAEAEKAIKRLHSQVANLSKKIIYNSDFFSWWQQHKNNTYYDVIIGNPPFIRYQSFPEPHRSLAMEIMKSQGLTPNKLTNIWVPFVVAATASLKLGGRLALVLPAEILQVTYAAQLRAYLTENFESIKIVACNELFFEKAEQEVILLLADGALKQRLKSNNCKVSLIDTKSINEIILTPPELLLRKNEPKNVCHESEKWLKYFLNNKQISFMRTLRQSTICANLTEYAHVNVGVVTGKNEFFVLSAEKVHSLGIEKYTTPLISRSAHLKGSILEHDDLSYLAEKGNRVFLLNISNEQLKDLSPEILKFIQEGEHKQYHKGYKCSIRHPWFQVPSVWVPDGFSFRQIYDFPRIVLNNTQATSTDTIHRFRSKGENPGKIIANTYTWLTAASAEIEGRSYGGGVLELEPKEAERLLIPRNLNDSMPIEEVDKLIKIGKIDMVLEENAKIILQQSMGLSKEECILLKDVWVKMRDRRNSRQRIKR